MRLIIIFFTLFATGASAATLDDLVAAYPDALAGHTEDSLIWKDGTRMPVATQPAAIGLEAMLRHGSILDQLSMPFPEGMPVPPPEDDPGRIRNKDFFNKMYGDCHKGEVAPHLVSITWLPQSWGHRLQITDVNGVAAQLDAISHELEALPPDIRRLTYPSAGTYNCRGVADTGQTSMHGWGAAIDLNTKYSAYWMWQHTAPAIPSGFEAIVPIFEKHGFIWGGKWRHFDTMHFEYRPELLR